MERLIDGVWYDESEITMEWNDQHKSITYAVIYEEEEEENPLVLTRGSFMDCN